jgi:hypothetical protein
MGVRSRILCPGTRRRRTVRGAVVLGAVVAAVLSASPASGHYLWHEDADDTSSSFDLQGVRLFKKTEPVRGIVRVRTTRRSTSAKIHS